VDRGDNPLFLTLSPTNTEPGFPVTFRTSPSDDEGSRVAKCGAVVALGCRTSTVLVGRLPGARVCGQLTANSPTIAS